MSAYIDPKDQPIETDDAVLRAAWEDRRALRVQRATLAQREAKLDIFIEIYIERQKPKCGPERAPQVVLGRVGP